MRQIDVATQKIHTEVSQLKDERVKMKGMAELHQQYYDNINQLKELSVTMQLAQIFACELKLQALTKEEEEAVKAYEESCEGKQLTTQELRQADVSLRKLKIQITETLERL